MRRLINFRAFLIVALAVACAVFSVYLYMINSAAGIVIGCIVICVLCWLSCLFIIKFKRKIVKLRVVIAFTLAVALSACAFFIGISYVNEWNSGMRYDGYCYVTGRVCAINVATGKYKIDLDDITLDGDSVNGSIRISFEDDEFSVADIIRCGDILRFGANVRAVKLIDNGKVNGTAYRTNIRYTALVGSNDVSMSTGEARLLDDFLDSMRVFYTETMGDRYGNIAYSMLTGDKHALDYGTTLTYSAAGIGHILAVSGLHIGFIVLLLGFLLSKFGRKVRYSIIAVVLLLYCVIADFSPSVVRAVIMAVVSGIGMLIGGRRDLLSSLCLSFSLILGVKPLYMFENGFIFSFTSILGIALFSNSVKRFLVKHGAHNKIGNAIGASTAVTVTTFPACSYLVKYINPLSLIVNAVLLPYITVVFIVIVVFSPIAAIPGCGVLMTVPKYLLAALDHAAVGLSYIPYAVIPLKTAGAVFLCYPIMFFGSEFVMFPKKCKTAVTLYSAAACIAIMGLCAII